MIHQSLRINVLSRPDHHSLCRGHIDERRLARICVRNPYRDGKSIRVAAKVDGYGTAQMQQQRAGTVGESCGRKGQALDFFFCRVSDLT